MCWDLFMHTIFGYGRFILQQGLLGVPNTHWNVGGGWWGVWPGGGGADPLLANRTKRIWRQRCR